LVPLELVSTGPFGGVSALVKLRLAREAAREEPGLVRHLDGLVDQLEEVLDDLRQVGHGIYPALLRDVGLPRALAAVAGRGIPPAQLDVEAVGRYSSEIEEAVYFCCLEALQNVGKHAEAASRPGSLSANVLIASSLRSVTRARAFATG
jgi:signal transduction histidine kinase